MRKFVSIILCVSMLFCIVALSGCSASTSEELQQRAVVDMLDKTIELPKIVEKYCILYSSAVPMCGMLDDGFAHMCICPTLYADWTYELFPDLDEHAITVDKKSVTAEQIINEGAQVVFWSSSTHIELVQTLERLGIACVNVSVNDAEDLLHAMNIIAETLGTDFAKEQLVKYEAKFSEYQAYAEEHSVDIPENEKKSILVLGGVDDTTGFGKDAYEAYWADLVGLDYIIPSSDGADKVTLTMEQIYEFDPDIIVVEGFFDEESIYNDPSWNSLRAVQNHMIISNPSVLDTWSKPGAEAPLQYIWAFSALNADYAGEVDVMAEVIAFYKDFYQYEMSEEDATEMLAGHRIIFDDKLNDEY